jgi:hypothetical protein
MDSLVPSISPSEAIMTVEQAYEDIASALLTVVQDRSWSSIQTHVTIHTSMTEESVAIFDEDEIDRSRYIDSPEVAGNVLRAALFLRDDLLKTRGDKISAFTATLLKNGKFRIDYEYANSVASG